MFDRYSVVFYNQLYSVVVENPLKDREVLGSNYTGAESHQRL